MEDAQLPKRFKGGRPKASGQTTDAVVVGGSDAGPVPIAPQAPPAVSGGPSGAPTPPADAAAASEPARADEPTAIAPTAAAPAETVNEAAASPVVDSDAFSDGPTTAAQQIKEAADMATIIPDSANPAANADKVQAMFGDMSSRFKAALEKSQKLGEELVELTKGNVEALVASARVAAKGGEAIGQEMGEYSRKSIEGAIAAAKGFASVKSPTELFQLQSDYLKSSFDSAVAEASKLSESMLKIAGEVTQPLSSRYAVAADKIKSATI